MALCIVAAVAIHPLHPQALLGQIGTDGGIKEREATTFSVNANATLIVTSPFSNLVLETSRRNVIRTLTEEGRRIYILAAGTEKITIRVKGYEPLELEPFPFEKKKVYDLKIIEVRAPRAALTAVGKGSILLSTEPPGASIVIDGLPGAWTTPAKIENVIATSYTLTATKQKYDTTVVPITIIQDSLVVKNITLTPNFGFIRITTDADAIITLNNRPIRNLGMTILEVPVGRNEVRLGKKRYRDFVQFVEMTPGDTVVINRPMIPDFAFFDFSRMPANTRVTVDNATARVGMVVEVSPGEHTVSIENQRVGQLSKKISLAPGETRRLIESDLQDPGELVITSDVVARAFIDDSLITLAAVNENIPSGLHTIRLEHRDLGTETRTIPIIPGRRREIFISMRPSRSTANWLILFPGWSQIYKGQTGKGWVYLTLFSAAAVSSYYFNDELLQRNRHYSALVDEYATTTSSSRAIILNSAITEAYPKILTVQKYQKTSLGIAGAIFLWNMLDALIFSPQYGYREKDDSMVDMTLGSKGHDVTMGFAIPF